LNTTVELSLTIIPYLALGFIGGLAYFRLLAIGLKASLGGGTWVSGAGWHAARVVGAVAVFWGVATQGAVALLACFGGFLAARLVSRKREADKLASSP